MSRNFIRTAFSVLLVLTFDNVAFSQFNIDLDEKSNIVSIAFAGTSDELVAWQSDKDLSSVVSFYTSSSCSSALTSCFRRCPKIEHIWLGLSPDCVEIESGAIKELDRLSTLKELRIYGANSEPGEFTHVKDLRSLEVLEIAGGVRFNKSDFTAIGKFKSLKSLRIECESIEDCRWLEGLPLLHDLTIDSKKLGREVAEILPQLTGLRSLSVHGHSFEANDLLELQETLGKKLEHLALEVEDPSAIEIVGHFHLLESLNLSTRRQGKSSFNILHSLPRLKILYANGWSVKGAALNTPADFPHLLQVRITDLTGRCLINWLRGAKKEDTTDKQPEPN